MISGFPSDGSPWNILKITYTSYLLSVWCFYLQTKCSKKDIILFHNSHGIITGDQKHSYTLK